MIDLKLESVNLPGGISTELEVIRHPGGAVAIAINETDNICLIKQYRHAAGGWLWELPGGRIEPGEAAIISAQRELREEVGLEASDWQPLINFWSTPGFCTEILYLFCARGLSDVPTERDEHEVLEVHWMPIPEALALCDSGEITDAKTLLGLYKLARVLDL